MIEIQLDFNIECNSINKFSNFYKDNPYVIIPKCYHNTKSIIMMSYEKGDCLNELNIDDLADAHDMLLAFAYQSLFINKYFHSDFHSGNIRYRKETKQIVIYDFGLMIEFNDEIIEQFIHIMLCPPTDIIDVLIKPGGFFTFEEKSSILNLRKNISECDEHYYKPTDASYVRRLILFINKCGGKIDTIYFTFLVSMLSTYIICGQQKEINDGISDASTFHSYMVIKVKQMIENNKVYRDLYNFCVDCDNKFNLQHRVDRYNKSSIERIKNKFRSDIDIDALLL
jgi:hypothetical protein